MDSSDLFKPVQLLTPIVGALLALAGVLFTLLSQIRAYRSQSDGRFRNLDERNKAIALWVTWLEAQKAACDPEELKRAQVKVQERLYELAEPPPTRISPFKLPFDAKHVLLISPPRRGGLIWLARAPFLFLAMILAVYVLATAGAQALIFMPNVNKDDLIAFTVSTFILVALLLLARFFALAIDGDIPGPKQATVKSTEPRTPVAGGKA